MKKFDPILIIIVVVSLIVIGGIILAFNSSSSSNISEKSYQKTDINKPKLEISETNFDFGKMNVKDIRTKKIKIKNTGSESLIMKNFSTSCNCTFIQLKTEKDTGPKLSMHSNSDWKGELPANSEATIIVTYQPSLMPVQGEVSRSAFFKTNDPENPEVTIKFKATVE